MIKYEKVLGYNVVSNSSEELLEQIRSDIYDKNKKLIYAINPEKIITAKKDVEIDRLLKDADYLIPDGNGIIFASKKFGGNIENVLTGVDFFENLCKLAMTEKIGVYLLGAREEVVSKASKNIDNKYGNIVYGYMNGYEKDDNRIVESINKSKAKILFVAKGSPTQELWIRKNKDRLEHVVIFQGVGGTFDVVSGKVKRAPLLFRKLKLEWLYRMLTQPSRILRNFKLLEFIILVYKERKNGK